MVKTYLDGDDLTILHEYLDEAAITDAPAPLSKQEADDLLGSIHHQVQVNTLLESIAGDVNAHSNAADVNADNTGKVLKINRRRFNWQLAASLIFILTCGGLAVNLWQQKGTEAGIARQHQQWSVIDNHTTGIKKAVLTDGTVVWLNSGSSLAYQPLKFDQHRREVKVSGEAFFDVAHNAKKPFIVHTGNLSTTVLGTAFNVEAYRSEAETKVTLVRGRVRIKTENDSLILTPGQMLKYSHQTKSAAIITVDTRQANAWTTGKISFNDVALNDALKRVEVLYNVNIVINKPNLLSNKRLTGVFERKTIDKVLANILFVHGLKWKKKGGDYIIQQ